MKKILVLVFALIAFIGVVSAGIVSSHSLKVSVYDYSTSQSITADTICVDGGCVYNKQSHTFSVSNGYHNIFVGENNYKSYSSSMYVGSNALKNVYLTGGSGSGGVPVGDYSLTVKVYDYNTNQAVYADNICVDSHCVQNKKSYTFTVTSGYHRITVGDDNYKSYTSSMYVGSNALKNVYLTPGGCGIYNPPAPSCTAGYLNSYRCGGDWVQRLYKNSDCSQVWKNWESCSYGCENGACISQPTCDPGYLDSYRCSNGDVQRKYQSSTCTESWKNWETCSYGCENNQCKSAPVCNVEVYDLAVNDDTVPQNGDVNISVHIKNSGDDTESITVRFYYRDSLKDVKDYNLNQDQSRTVSFDLNGVEYSGYAKIEAETCNNVKDSEIKRINIEQTHVEQGNLKVTVHKGLNCDVSCSSCDSCGSCYDSCGSCDRNLQGAKVEIKRESDGYTTYKYTDSEGEVTFYGIPEGDYEITVTKSGYTTRKTSVEVEDDQTASTTIELPCCSGGGECSFHDLEVRRVVLPDEIHAGETISIETRVKNMGRCTENDVKVSVTAFGQTKITSSFSIGGNSERTMMLQFTIPSTYYGSYDVVSKVWNNNDEDQLKVDAFVRESGAILKLDPYTVHVDEDVHVYGYISGSSSAKLYLGSTYVRTVYADSTGYYSTYVTPNKVGKISVSLKGNGFDVSKYLTVIADLWVTKVKAKDLVAVGETFTVCSDIQTTKTGYVDVGLYVDGNKYVQKRSYITGSQTVCFETKILNTGKKELRIIAVQDDKQDYKTSEIEVIKPNVEVLVIPKNLMIEYGDDGMLKVVVTNADPEEKTYNVSLSEMDQIYVDIPVDSATLEQYESKTFYVNINPHKQGEFESVVTVKANDVVLEQVPIKLYTSQEYVSFSQRVGAFFHKLGRNIGTIIGLTALGIVIIVVLISILYVGFFRETPMEPHYN